MDDLYSVEQVADLLGLHVRTVRGYIRDGRLRAVRIGKQYRIARADLDALTGRSTPAEGGRTVASLEVSSVVQVDGVDRRVADRLATLVLAGANTGPGQDGPMRVQSVYDEERHRMKIVILGGAASTAELLKFVEAVVNEVIVNAETPFTRGADNG